MWWVGIVVKAYWLGVGRCCGLWAGLTGWVWQIGIVVKAYWLGVGRCCGLWAGLTGWDAVGDSFRAAGD